MTYTGARRILDVDPSPPDPPSVYHTGNAKPTTTTSTMIRTSINQNHFMFQMFRMFNKNGFKSGFAEGGFGMSGGEKYFGSVGAGFLHISSFLLNP